MVNDQGDRLVYTQEAKWGEHNQWMAILYDGLNRPSATGMITYIGNRDQLQQYVTANTGTGTSNPVTVNGSTPVALPQALDLVDTLANGDRQAQNLITLDNGFNTPDVVDFTAEIVAGSTGSNGFTNTLPVVDNPLPPTANFIALTMTFYDDYSNTPDKQYAVGYNGLLDAGPNQHAEILPAVTDQQAVPTIGLVTGTKVRVLEDPSDLTKGSWLATASFYDDRTRVVQTQGDNYKGGRDTIINRYNFTGQVITSYLAHADPAAPVNNNTRIKTNLNYDHTNRLLQVYKTINDADSTKRLLAQHVYDQLGQL